MDSGGRASFATGQGMVEGCTSDFAVMEETDSGNFYLTIRMSLMDYTSGHSFQVQLWLLYPLPLPHHRRVVQ